MRYLNILFKQINLLNLLLLVGIALVVVLFVTPLFIGKFQTPLAVPATGEQNRSVPEAQPVVPPMQEYSVVSENNLFHSKRIVPPKKTEEVIQRPEFVLYGTLIIDNLRFAYLSDNRAPRSTPGRGRRQTGLKLGESMSGYTLKDVMPDRIIMVRGDDRMEVKVIAPGGRKNRGSDSPATVSPKTSKPAVARPTPRHSVTPRGTIPPAPSPAARRLRNNR